MKKILVIDDDIDILNVLKLVLTYNKFSVKTSWQWQTIVKTIRAFSPDLILLDIDLGGADGSEICEKLKQSKETQHVPVILISVHNVSEKYLKECNAQGYIAKPFELSTLLETVTAYLN